MDWISFIVVLIIILFVISIFYKGVIKQSIDSILASIKRGFMGVGDKAFSASEGIGEVVVYE